MAAVWTWIGFGILAFLLVVLLYDLIQTKHAILRSFPLIGHIRYLLEKIGPELRQYIVTENDADRPFSRDQRRWIYASAKQQNNLFGFGTDNDLDIQRNYLIIKHAAFPKPDLGFDEGQAVPAAKVLGGPRQRAKAFTPASLVNISSMSYGSLSGAAVTALNKGANLAGALHGSGEGGLTTYHDQGGDLVWQIGTGYFGCRDAAGNFDLGRFLENVDRFPVKAIEVKLSQGAKPGLGGLLPGKKVTPEIAAIRGIPVGEDCHSPPGHSSFHDVDSMLDFVELLASETGLPVGIKSAVGEIEFWEDLADQMVGGERGVDFIIIDGGEGGTGAGPLAFTDHVALPFLHAFPRVHDVFTQRGVVDQVMWIGSGRLGLPDRGLLAMTLGVDMINVGREAMMAAGCIQAQRCHTGHCPTGVATNSKWLERGLDPTDKGLRVGRFIQTMRFELGRMARACGVDHPSQVSPAQLEIINGMTGSRTAHEIFINR